jgi:hypothetical protein
MFAVVCARREGLKLVNYFNKTLDIPVRTYEVYGFGKSAPHAALPPPPSPLPPTCLPHAHLHPPPT